MNTIYAKTVYERMTKEKKEISYEDFYSTLKRIDTMHEHKETLSKIKIDPDSPNRHFNIRVPRDDDMSVTDIKTVSIISDREREGKRVIREKMMQENAKCFHANLSGNKPYEDIYRELGQKDDPRNFVAFFKAPNGLETCQKLKDPNLSVDEKKEIFNEYFDGYLNRVKDLMVAPKNDAELAEKYSEIFSACQPMSLETLDDATKAFGFKVDQTTNEKFKTCKTFVQGVQENVAVKADRILDETYLYFNGEDSVNISKALEADGVAFAGYDDTGLEGAPSQVFLHGEKMSKYMKYQHPQDKLIDFMKATGTIDDKTVFVGKDGILSKEQADQAIHNNERIECVNGKGEVTTLSFDETGMMKAKKDVAPTFSPENKKMFEDKFKNCLDTLNSGTSLFTISSKEYKGMRNILKNLSSGIGDRKEAGRQVKEFKELMDTYIKNHDKKETLSPTALKRKECVDKVKEEMDTLFDAFDVDNNLVKEAVEKNTELSKTDEVRRSLNPETQMKLDEDVRDVSIETAKTAQLPERESSKERTVEAAPQKQDQ